MVRLLSLLLLLTCIASTGCGYVAVSGAINPNTQMVAGLVSIVQFQYVNGSASVTVVTLVGSGTAQTLSFCGDQRPQFPVNQFVNASFERGSSCNTLVAVSLH
jgi:hypothetical protein